MSIYSYKQSKISTSYFLIHFLWFRIGTLKAYIGNLEVTIRNLKIMYIKKSPKRTTTELLRD